MPAAQWVAFWRRTLARHGGPLAFELDIDNEPEHADLLTRSCQRVLRGWLPRAEHNPQVNATRAGHVRGQAGARALEGFSTRRGHDRLRENVAHLDVTKHGLVDIILVDGSVCLKIVTVK